MSNLAQEHADHVFGAQYDDVRERYAAELEDLKADDRAYEYEQQYRTKVWEVGFGDDLDAYEDSWKRTFAYAESGAVDDLMELE
jgi:hypothetical protein